MDYSSIALIGLAVFGIFIAAALLWTLWKGRKRP
jgi:cbb3-type cytochrome oxidase subunit 3